MPKRSSIRQSKHDQQVKKEAQKLRRGSWNVEADIPGFEPPKPIGEYKRVPDIVAKKGGKTKIIEVETPNTLAQDKEQRETFRRSAAQRRNTTFETLNTES